MIKDEIGRLTQENEMLREALCSFGCYPDEWDNFPGKTRLELRIETPAGKWAAARVTWKIAELQKAKRILIQKARADQARVSPP